MSIWFCFVKCEELCPWEQLIFGVKINNWSRNSYRTNVTLSLMLRRQCVILRLNVGKSQRPWNCSNQRSFECCDVESAKPFHCQWMYFAIAHRRSWFKSVCGVPSTKGNGNAHALYKPVPFSFCAYHTVTCCVSSRLCQQLSQHNIRPIHRYCFDDDEQDAKERNSLFACTNTHTWMYRASVLQCNNNENDSTESETENEIETKTNNSHNWCVFKCGDSSR